MRLPNPLIQRVIGFFVAKGLLIDPQCRPYHGKLDVPDVLLVAKHEEPRIFEVLPAALINFPSAFLHQEKLPTEIREIINAIKKGITEHPDYKGISYRKMKTWAELQRADRRTKPIKEKRKMKAFRLLPETIQKLDKFAKRNKVTSTEALEQLIAKA